MSNNSFNGTFDMGTNFSSALQLVDLQYNSISRETSGLYDNKLLLRGNPYCNSPVANSEFCQPPSDNSSYSTDIRSCGNKSCANNEQQLIPVTCGCAAPLTMNFTFTAPSINDVSDKTLYLEFEQALGKLLSLSVRLQNIHINDSYLQVQTLLFPSQGTNFSLPEILEIVFILSNKSFNPPRQFGPYTFLLLHYSSLALDQNSSPVPGVSRLMVAGIAGGASVLVLILVLLGFYALRQKKRAERMTEMNGRSGNSATKLVKALDFEPVKLNKCTGSVSPGNEIGHGGYGKVYRGTHPDGQTLAIKRAQQGSIQGALQFKTEIELLSRVHHKNLVGLVGFCIELGEQMLVYEFMVNGSFRESLSGNYYV
ncbi:hypothetical protein MLD38_023957 [Melastoma candidum]|uniref:Uncharacterized protein n=1 Tax=Melastoma candidum TaxID=119954 RepID=A0ACB9NRT7_9MYRT|nr:hypothetical protein MLD38_023957 [Melastoma candidum]